MHHTRLDPWHARRGLLATSAAGPKRVGARLVRDATLSMARFARIAGIGATLLCFLFLGERLAKHYANLPAIRWDVRATVWIVAAVSLVVSIEMAHSLAWRTLVRAVNPTASWREAFAVCGRSQIAKYLPGNAFHYVQRVVLTRGTGLPAGSAVVLTATDAVLLAVTGALVGLPAVEDLARTRTSLPPATLILWIGAGTLLGIAILVFTPRLRAQVIPYVKLLAPARVVGAATIDALLLLLPAVVIYLVLDALWPGQTSLGWFDFVPGFALAFFLGFVTPGAPGGIGIREVVLYALFAPALGAALAASLFLAVRVVFIIGDVATFLVASAVTRSARP